LIGSFDLAQVWDMTDTRPWEGSETAVPVYIEARITEDPHNDMGGVMGQVRRRLEFLASTPDYRLMDFPGSLVDGARRRRRRRDPVTRQLIGFPLLGEERWPPGCLVDNDTTAAVGPNGEPPARPEHGKGEAMLLSREAGGVTAEKPDRIWRSPVEYGTFRNKVKNRPESTGVRVLAGGHDFNLSRGQDNLVLSLLTDVAAHEVEQTQERERNTLRLLAELGAKHGIASFGYRAVHLEPGDDPLGVRKMHEPAYGESGACTGCAGRKPARWRSMVLEPREAEALYDAGRRVWTCINCGQPVLLPNRDCSGQDEDGRDRHRGESLPPVLGVLDDQWQTPTKTGLPWRLSGPSSLSQVLRNPVYLGQRVHVSDSSGGAERRAAWEDPEAAGRYTAGWPAIFTAAEHQDLVTLLTRKAKGRGNWNTKPAHLLTGLAWCGMCGGKMFYGGGQYRCISNDVVRSAREVEGEVRLRILLWMGDTGLYDKAQATTDSDDVAKLKQDKKTAEDDLDAMARAGAAARWSTAKLDAELAPHHALVARLQREIKTLEHRDEMADVSERGEKFSDRWEKWDAAGDIARQREIAGRLIARVVVWKAPHGVRPADRRFIQVWPAGWAEILPDPGEAAPLPVPDPEALRPRARVLAWLAEYGGLASVAEVAGGCSAVPCAAPMSEANARKVLRQLEQEGAVQRAWCSRGTAWERAAPAERGKLAAAETARRGVQAFGGTGCWGYRLPAA
jgi:hypothetical protein